MSTHNKRFVPHASLYDTAARLNKYAQILLYISSLLSLIISAIDYLKNWNDLNTPLIVVNSLLICLFVFFDNRANFVFTKAEMKRRLDYLDNSFGTNFSGKKSENYFTNDKLSPGLYKLCVNCFENSYHTEFIIKKMFIKILPETIIIILLFIISAYIGNREVIRTFFELILPLSVIQKLIKAIFFTSRMNQVVENFKSLFNDLMRSNDCDKTPEFIRDILDYETTISWASIPLDSKIFEKFKNKLAADWAELTIAYNIKSE